MSKSFSGVAHNPRPTTARGQARARRRALAGTAAKSTAVRAWIYGENETARRRERQTRMA